jgi:hypothetical protein
MTKLRSFIFALLCFFAVALTPSRAPAACTGGNCYWIAGGNGNWSAAGNWSTSSGGASCACTPGTTDAVNFNAASAAAASTIDASITVGSAIFTGYTGTLTHNTGVTLSVSGTTFTFVAGMTYTPANSTTAIVAFTATSGTTNITTAGKNFAMITINGAGGTFALQDNLTVNIRSVSNGDSALNLTAGTLTVGANNLTIQDFVSNTTNTRILNMGSGTWTLLGSAANITGPWDTSTDTGMTLNIQTATIALNGTSTTDQRQFSVGANNKVFGPITLGTNSSTQPVDFIGSPTFSTFGVAAPISILITVGQTLTVSNAFTWTGSAGNEISLRTSNNGGTVTLSVPSGTPSMTWAALAGVICTGGATFAATNSFDLGGNTGCGIVAPSGGGGGGPNFIGGSL